LEIQPQYINNEEIRISIMVKGRPEEIGQTSDSGLSVISLDAQIMLCIHTRTGDG
jgi:hypothetical protein